MSKELLSILIAASPLAELRGALPMAILVWGMPIFKAYLLSVVGNFLPAIPLILFWRHLAGWLMRRNYYLNRLFSFIFEHVRRRFLKHQAIFENLGLLVLTAIPIPVLGGVWTASVAVFLFDIPLRRASLMLSLGVLISGLVVLFLSSLIL